MSVGSSAAVGGGGRVDCCSPMAGAISSLSGSLISISLGEDPQAVSKKIKRDMVKIRANFIIGSFR
jgi:hypothetical protein